MKKDKASMPKPSMVTILLAIVTLISASAAVYFYMQANTNKQDQAAVEVKQVVDRLAELMQVPDETPTVAKVTDKEKLKDQPFFKDAETGDRLIIFPKAKKAVIYRESTNKIVNVGPIAITSQKANQVIDNKNDDKKTEEKK